jgi:hypothetical protein
VPPLLVIALALVLTVGISVLLWRELSGWTLGVHPEAELATFPQPEGLTIASDESTGSGAPFFGTRRGHRRVYASDVGAGRTCDRIRSALAAWQVAPEEVPGAVPAGEGHEPGSTCDLAGLRSVGPTGGLHVRVTVYGVEQWDRLPTSTSSTAPLNTAAEAVVDLRTTVVPVPRGGSR